MSEAMVKTRLSKIKKRGTYSRLLKKYRDRFRRTLNATTDGREINNESSVVSPSSSVQRTERSNSQENSIIAETIIACDQEQTEYEGY